MSIKESKASLLAVTSATAILLVAPPSYAGAAQPYVSLFGGASLLAADPMGLYATSPANIQKLDFQVGAGYIIGGTIGAKFGNGARAEIELSHSAFTGNNIVETPTGLLKGTPAVLPYSSTATATYLLGNIWYDVPSSGRFTPYFGGGAGVAFPHLSAVGFGDFNQSVAPALQLGAGVTFDITDHLRLDVGYRFKDIVGLNLQPTIVKKVLAGGTPLGASSTDTNWASHNFQFGLSYSF